ncbi:hypothetical protein [Pandoraea iniqua]|uniref:hypothetical protein n=1 Tax=Pandoraea iniqua TaxID=2508288 RepID=UPI001242C9E5|nr:hypothetical protein [Pandoraea iniqua]
MIATLEAISSVSTELNVVATAAGIGLSLLGAPVWLTIIAGLGLASADVPFIVAKLGDAEVEIAQTYLGEVALTSTIPPDKPITLPRYPEFEPPTDWLGFFEEPRRLGAHIYRTPACSYSAPQDVCREFPLLPPVSTGIALRHPEYALEIPFISISELEDLRTRWIFDPGDPDPQLKIIYKLDEIGDARYYERMWTNKAWPCIKSVPSSCPAKYQWVTMELNLDLFDITLDGYHGRPRITTRTVYSNLDDVQVGMNSNFSKMPLSPQTLANIVDEVWLRAAELPHYVGMPYRESEPVTEEDVEIWVKANPQQMPYIGDVFEPANDPDEERVTISPRIRPREDPAPQTDPEINPRADPVATPVTNPKPALDPENKTDPDPNQNKNPQGAQDVNVINRPTVDIGNRVKVDIDVGDTPKVGEPKLEKTPTAKMIVEPILGLTSDFKSWSMPSHGASCPRTSLHVFDHTIAIDAHCDIAERVAPQLRQAMLAAFAVMALLIVLSA